MARKELIIKFGIDTAWETTTDITSFILSAIENANDRSIYVIDAKIGNEIVFCDKGFAGVLRKKTNESEGEQMNELNGKWTVSLDEEYFNECEYFDTKEEAMAFGKSYEEFEGKGFYVGQIESIQMHTDFLGDHCIDYIQEYHYNNDGEFGQDYLDNVKKEHLVELDEIIKNAVLDWATRYGYHPSHFLVRSVEYIESEGE